MPDISFVSFLNTGSIFKLYHIRLLNTNTTHFLCVFHPNFFGLDIRHLSWHYRNSTIRTIEGLLTKEKKQTLHRRITDLLVEIEGNSKPEFAGFVIINIKEEPAENFSMGGIQASAELFGLPDHQSKKAEEIMNSIKHSKKFMINQPIEILFPLFSAEGEKLWVPGQDYENVMESNDLQEDYIFLTQNHDHASSKAIWIVKRYDPKSYYVQFYKVEPDDKVGTISVQCFQITESKTEVEVTYHYVGIAEKGNEFVKNFTAEEYTKFINEWELLLQIYFASK